MNPKEAFHNTAYSVQLPYYSRSVPLDDKNVKLKSFTHFMEI